MDTKHTRISPSKTLNAHLIVIGDELMTGKINDINTSQVAKWLEKEGIELTFSTLCPDKKDHLIQTLTLAWEQSDLVITTGGLGPTQDDITKATLGEFFKGKLKENLKAKELAKLQYGRIQKEWNPNTNAYHLIPEGMEPVANPKGLAPGLCYKLKNKKDSKLFLAAPGVPRELRGMIETEFPSFLDETFPARKRSSNVLTIRTIGVPEEKIFFHMMPELWEELSTWGKVSSLPQVLGVDIHLTIEGDRQKLEEAKVFWKKKLENGPLAENIWSWESKKIEELVIEEAIEKKLTLSLAESCTGGLVAHRLTNIPGSSQVLLSSVVAYANQAKETLLGVKSETLKSKGAVSEETALEMAMGVREKIKSDISVSLTGIAGPGGGSLEKPVGLVCIGLDSDNESFAKTFSFKGDREHLKKRFSEMALYQVLKRIRGFKK